MQFGLLSEHLPRQSSLPTNALVGGRNNSLFLLMEVTSIDRLVYYTEPLAKSSFLEVYELLSTDDLEYVVGAFVLHRPMQAKISTSHAFLYRRDTRFDELPLVTKYKWFGEHLYFIEGDHSCLIGRVQIDSVRSKVARKIGDL